MRTEILNEIDQAVDLRTPAYAVFEGGGAQAFAHIGALQAAEKTFRLTAVAGTSAGAIIAALVAARFTGEDLLSCDAETQPGKSIINSASILEIVGSEQWAVFQSLRRAIDKAVSAPNLLVKIWRWVLLLMWRGLQIYTVIRSRGLLDTIYLQTWLNAQLISKISEKHAASINTFCTASDGVKQVSFLDLKNAGGLDLTIVASSLSNGGVCEFSAEKTPNTSVATAVAASSAIPFVFKPVRVEGIEGPLVDGGLVSNYPAYCLREHASSAPDAVPTIGFRLRAKRLEASENWLKYVRDILKTAAFGGIDLQLRGIDWLLELPTNVDIGVMQFDLCDNRLKEVVNRSYLEASNHIASTPAFGIHKPKQWISAVLDEACKIIRHYLGLDRDCHLRANIMLVVNPCELQMAYTFNMESDDDTDDRLRLRKGAGASGQCWERSQVVLCKPAGDFRELATSWRLDKYTQKLVRGDLESLLCIPLKVKAEVFDSACPHKIIGVLSFDSCDKEFLLKAQSLQADNQDQYQRAIAVVSKIVVACLMSTRPQ